MTMKRTLAGALAGFLALGTVGVATASAAPATTSKATSCNDDANGHWPLGVQGRPYRLDAGDRGGAYTWHDSNGWHIRVTHAGTRERDVSGIIHTTGELYGQRVLDERGDKVWVSRDHHTLAFKFHNYGRLDGVDFHTRCAPRLAFGFATDGHRLATDRVYLGLTKRHPGTDPFTIPRVG